MAETRIDEIINVSIKYLNYLKSKDIPFNKAYLFGSYAKGNPKDYSDIDLAIISDEWKPDRFEAQAELIALTRGLDTRIEPHPIETADFNESNPFAYEIMTHGVEIKIN